MAFIQARLTRAEPGDPTCIPCLNGDQFYANAGQLIDLPDHRADRPGRDFLEWHLDEVFKAS